MPSRKKNRKNQQLPIVVTNYANITLHDPLTNLKMDNNKKGK